MNELENRDPASIVTHNRQQHLCELIKELSTFEVGGALAEVGVYKGGTARLMAKWAERFMPGRDLFLFDTFEGMPDWPHESDNHHKKGDFNDTSLEAVQQHLSDCKNVRFYPGLFPDTAFACGTASYSSYLLVHVDCDIYHSVKACCEFFWPRMVKGGVIVFDDYSESTCRGAQLAVDEFFKGKAMIHSSAERNPWHHVVRGD